MRAHIDLAANILFEDAEDDKRSFWLEMQPHYRGTGDAQWSPSFTSWPPSRQELLSAERQINQHPEWIAYWAKFGWRSWQEADNYYYDKRTRRVRFYDVPHIANIHGKFSPDRASLEIDLDGNVHERESKYAQFYIPMPSAIHACMAVVNKVRANLKYLDGEFYIRFGRWREGEQSRNGITGELEAGVSAYHANYNFDDGMWEIDPTVSEESINGTMNSFFSRQDQKVFLVQGRELEELGSDDEPLLKDVRLIKKLTMRDVCVPGMFDPADLFDV
jgi:hypothetical protein